jgi:hypothetical protein
VYAGSVVTTLPPMLQLPCGLPAVPPAQFGPPSVMRMM